MMKNQLYAFIYNLYIYIFVICKYIKHLSDFIRIIYEIYYNTFKSI